jgi:hypothetical protein
MANNLSALAMNPEFAPQVQGLERQRKMAEMLMTQGFQPQQGQMVSGHYVAPSWAQNLAGLANIWAGKSMQEEADTKQMELAQKLRQGRNAVEESIISKMSGSPAVLGQAPVIPEGQTLRDDNGMLTYGAKQGIEARPAIAPDFASALREIRTNPYDAGKEFMPTILKKMLPDDTEMQKNYQTYKNDGGKLNFTDWMDRNENQRLAMERERLNLDKQRLGIEAANANKMQIIETPNGYVGVDPRNPSRVVPVTVDGKPLMGKNPLTEFQGKSGAYQISAIDAYKNMQKLEQAGLNPNTLKAQAQIALAGGKTNALASDEYQQYKQAQDQFANAYLRFQSGANMSETEIQRNLKNMMPAFGDNEKVIKQKQIAREKAIEAMGLSAGPANQLGQNPNLFNPSVSPKPSSVLGSPTLKYDPQTGEWK